MGRFFCSLVVGVCLVVSGALVPLAEAWGADEPEKGLLFAEPKKDWEWDEDKRFDFLVERLASLEASLDAINAAISKATGKKGAKLSEARRADENNTLMDRKGGGPMRWVEFYGKNAEKFFYHPVDPNTTYHTDTFLRQMGKGEDDKYDANIPSRQSVPVHQRPPQFDYIYKANRDARDRAEKEATALAGKVDALNERRIKLEREQAALWCLLAFRAIQRLDIPRKPVLRFQLISASGDTADVQKAEALAAAAKFLATALLIIEKAEDDQAVAFGNVKDVMTNARNEFDDALLNADAVAEDVADKKTSLGKYVMLAKLLDDTSSNLSESFEVAMEGDQSQDLARKDRFRGLLQQSLVEYAQIVLALDELAGVMKSDWKVKVDTKSKARGTTVSWGAAKVDVAASPASPATESRPSTSTQRSKEKGEPFPKLPAGAGKIDSDAPRAFTSTASGLKYRVLRQGTGNPPQATDTVHVNYHGWLDNGKTFDSSYLRRKAIDFPLRSVVPGWAEGMQLVGAGGMIELVVPSDLGYGPRGTPGGQVPPNATLHFLIELIEVR